MNRALLFGFLLKALRSHEYKLALADGLWQGHGQALRYIGHIKLLSTKLSNAFGAVTTLAPFVGGQSWELSFDLLQVGASGEGSAFGLTLSRAALHVEELELLAESAEALPIGFTLSIRGGRLRYSLRDSHQSVRAINGECPRDFSSPHIRLIWAGTQVRVLVSDAKNPNAALVDCGKVEFVSAPFERFNAAFWARSREPWRADVQNLLFESAAENTHIETYFSPHERSLPRLFRQINLLRSQPIAAPAAAPNAPLNISLIHSLELSIYQKLDVVGHLLAVNLEQSEEVVGAIEQQRQSAEEVGAGLLKALREWVSESAEQYATVARQTKELGDELAKFDPRVAYARIAALIADLRRALETNNAAFDGLRELAKVYKGSAELLANARRCIKRTPRLFSMLEDRLAETPNGGHDVALLVGVGAVGAAVIGVLGSVLRQLKLAQQRKLFE